MRTIYIFSWYIPSLVHIFRPAFLSGYTFAYTQEYSRIAKLESSTFKEMQAWFFFVDITVHKYNLIFLKCFFQILVGCIGRLVCVRPSDYAILEPIPTVSMQKIMDGGDDHEPSFHSSDLDRAQIMPPARASTSGRIQWRLMAIVLDRIFFVFFLTAVILFTITVVSH